MLHEFLSKYQPEIIQLCRNKVTADSGTKPTSELLEKGLPIFYKELVSILERSSSTDSSITNVPETHLNNMIIKGGAATHGKESLRLGYTISQVVHSYGAVCQSITEFVQTKSYTITSQEFQGLNLSLDCAIAEALTEYQKSESEKAVKMEIKRLGFLMHELKNSLSAATAAHQMIQKGLVGGAGVTAEVMSRSHDRMRRLIESADVEIRFRGHVKLDRTQIRLIDLVSEVTKTLTVKAGSPEIRLKLDVDPAIELTADRNLIFSALSNLVNNAMKFTKKPGVVSVRGKELRGHILVEVEDECGGLPEGDIEELFKPFSQAGSDKTGMGLGLPLSRRAIELNMGTLTARNIPKKGCVFTIDLPKDTQ